MHFGILHKAVLQETEVELLGPVPLCPSLIFVHLIKFWPSHILLGPWTLNWWVSEWFGTMIFLAEVPIQPRWWRRWCMSVTRRSKWSGEMFGETPLIAKVADNVGWAHLAGRLWEVCRMMVSRVMSHHHGRGNHPCHLCDNALLPEASVLEHILVTHGEQLHLDPGLDCTALLTMLDNLHVHLEVLSKYFLYRWKLWTLNFE